MYTKFYSSPLADGDVFLDMDGPGGYVVSAAGETAQTGLYYDDLLNGWEGRLFFSFGTIAVTATPTAATLSFVVAQTVGLVPRLLTISEKHDMIGDTLTSAAWGATGTSLIASLSVGMTLGRMDVEVPLDKINIDGDTDFRLRWSYSTPPSLLVLFMQEASNAANRPYLELEYPAGATDDSYGRAITLGEFLGTNEI